jgi:predicted RNA-binding Zn ribbon-like protein
VAKRRQRRRREKEQRHAPQPVRVSAAELGGPVERLVYSREQAAQALGISLATLDRRVVPAIATVKTEWGRPTHPSRPTRPLSRRAHRGVSDSGLSRWNIGLQADQDPAS